MVSLQHLGLGGVDLVHRPGNFEVKNLRGVPQAPGMLTRLEDRAAVGALAFEHSACVMERVRQDVDLRLAPGDHFAVQPDPSVAVVKGLGGHGFPLQNARLFGFGPFGGYIGHRLARS